MPTDKTEFSCWMTKLRLAAMRHCLTKGGLYYGVEGAKRLARECGPALLDFEDYEDLIDSTYSGICVTAYELRPPISEAVWLSELRRGMERAKR